MKLGFESKGEFLAAHLISTIESFFHGRNHHNDNFIESEINSIIVGLSRAWDAAEEYEPQK